MLGGFGVVLWGKSVCVLFWWRTVLLFCLTNGFDGVGGWVSTGSPPVGELPCFARFWSRGFAEEPTGYWSVGRPGDDWSIV